MDQIEDIKALALQYIRGIWKNRWLAIVIAWPVMIGGIVAVDQIKDRYKAETQVYIDSSSVLKPLLRGLAIQSDFESTVRLMINKLLSRPNLERAARLMDMDINLETPQQMEALISKIRSRVTISATKRTGIYTITYSDELGQRAKKMVQTLLDIFVEDTLGTAVSQSDTAITFLDSQIEKYDGLLREAETRREEFMRKNVGLMPKDGANYYAQLEDNNARLEQSKLSLDESVNRLEKIRFQMESLKADSEVSIPQPGIDTSSHDARVADQEVKLQDLLLLYTDQHPDVINARLVLNSLIKRRDDEKARLEASREETTITSNSSANPAYQELLILLTRTEADISSYKTRVASLQKKQTRLKGLVDVVPQIEAELQRLNRDYEIHKKNYNEFVERREQARISEDVESGTDQVQFKIIEPPFVSSKADYPNRALFDAGVIILALGIGYGVSLLLSLLQPVFYNQAELASGLGRAVLGTISKFDTADVLAKRRRNLIMFALVNMLFVTVGFALLFVHSKGILILSTLQLKVMAL